MQCVAMFVRISLSDANSLYLSWKKLAYSEISN